MNSMDKVNFVFEGVKQKTKEFMMGGITVTAVDKVPFAEKIELAKYVVSRSIMEDDETPGIVIWSINEKVVEMQALLMFYTNANVEGMSLDAMRVVYDNLISDQGYKDFLDYIWSDRVRVEDIEFCLREAVIDKIKEKKKTGFGLDSLLEAFNADPNPEATITRNRELNEQLIDALKIVRQGE